LFGWSTFLIAFADEARRYLTSCRSSLWTEKELLLVFVRQNISYITKPTRDYLREVLVHSRLVSPFFCSLVILA
jgi:hypothetical protein